MTSSINQRTCLITGSRGYLGSSIKEAFKRERWNVVELVRNPDFESVQMGRAISFQLGQDVPTDSLRGATALVHCAHDFSLRDWKSIHATNVLGAEKLFSAAKQAGVQKKIFISSMSAYEGCRSMYGRAKLEVEKILSDSGTLLLRPGLIYGDRPEGIFGNLVKQAQNSRLLPLFGDGSQILYLSHQEDLARVMCDHAADRLPVVSEPVTAAHDKGWTFRSILEGLAQGRKLRFIKVPWRPAWLMIKCAELLHFPLPFRSDSLVSLMHQNLHPSFDSARRLGLQFRPFQPERLVLS